MVLNEVSILDLIVIPKNLNQIKSKCEVPKDFYSSTLFLLVLLYISSTSVHMRSDWLKCVCVCVCVYIHVCEGVHMSMIKCVCVCVCVCVF